MTAGTGAASLLVASTGGHLDELVRLRPRLADVEAVEWVTFASDQASGLLAGEVVHHVPYLGPRDYAGTLRNLWPADRLLQTGRYGRVVTTGAGIALPFALAAARHRVPFHYVESAARGAGPSLTGRLLSRVPRTRLHTQSKAWADGRWRYAGSVFDGFDRLPDGAERPLRRVVVTLGTMRRFGFRRAVEALCRVLPEVLEPGGEVLWQTGGTDCTGLPVRGRVLVPVDELAAAVAEADLVVAHAGVGSALTALDRGHAPVLLPRLARHREHVDDHQTLIAAELAGRGLAANADPAGLTADLLVTATRWRVGPASVPPPFGLAG